jgi:hypothetical protein
MVTTIGWIALGLAALIGALNFYLSWLRYPLYRLLGWEFHFVSGLPGIGTICLLLAIPCLWNVPGVWEAILAISIIDTGGLLWFLAIMTVEGGWASQ